MERRVIASAALAHAMTHSLELTFAALLVRIGLEFDASLATLGFVANVGTFTFGATALPSGLLTDRFGPRAVISGALAAAAGFALLVAASPNLPFLAVSLAILGAAIGLYHPPGTAMVSTVIERRGRAFALHGIAGNLGVALAPAIATGIAILVSWRAAYVVLAVLAVVVALVVRRFAPNREEAYERSRLATEATRASASATTRPARVRTTPPSERRWLAGPLLLIYAATIGTGFIYRGFLTFLPAHLEEHLGISIFGWSPEAVAGAMSSLVLLTAVFGQVLGGALSDRMPVERAAIPIVAATGPMLLLVGSFGGVPLLFAAAIFVLFNFAQQPVFNGMIADYAPLGAAGRAFGVSFFLTFGIGSFSATIAGLVADRWGIGPMFFMLAGVAFVLAAITVLVARGATERRRHLDAAHIEALAATGGD
ncbi:MAG: MFS transporter [Dehalococcoidia bacterium]